MITQIIHKLITKDLFILKTKLGKIKIRTFRSSSFAAVVITNIVPRAMSSTS